MDKTEVMAQLEAWGNQPRKKHYLRDGAGENCFGVTLGNLRGYARQIGANQPLALDLWRTENVDARLLACMILDPSHLEAAQARALVAEAHYVGVLDELVFSAIKRTSFSDVLMRDWLQSADDRPGRAGWALAVCAVTDRVALDGFLNGLIETVERELETAPRLKQWMMNRALCEIGIRYPAYTDRCVAIGERLGVYRDVKVAKGCTSPYAPEWIAAGVRKRR